jgi:hypothetical protein
MKIENAQNFTTNVQFSGGENISGSGQLNFLASGLYIGQQGNLVATTLDGSVLTFVSASGFIPGLFTAISGSSTATSIIALK